MLPANIVKISTNKSLHGSRQKIFFICYHFLFWLCCVDDKEDHFEKHKYFFILCSLCKFFFKLPLKLRSTGIDLQSSGLLRWVLGASWICISLFNSNFQESRHPLSSHLCVYSDTQSLALWNQSSWLMMRLWVCVTCMSGMEGASVSLWMCTFACLTVRVWEIFSVYLTVLIARESILVPIGIATSVVSCVSVSSRRFDWPSVALCRATSPLFLWEWQAYTESCPGVTASSQRHNWLTPLICSTAFPIHELSFLFTKRMGSTKHIHFILFSR